MLLCRASPGRSAGGPVSPDRTIPTARTSEINPSSGLFSRCFQQSGHPLGESVRALRVHRLPGWLVLLCAMASARCSSFTEVTEAILPLPDETQLISGATFSCLLRPDTDLQCWGRLGGTPQVTPPQVVNWAGMSPSFAVLNSSGHFCGLTVYGAAYCWGSNGNGQIGNGSTAFSSAPAAVATEVRFTAISPGISSTCAIDVQGGAHCWGLYGALGLGTVGDGGSQPTPIQVPGSLKFASIASSEFHCALTRLDDRAYCWGASAGSFGGRWEEPGDCVEVFFIAFTGADCLSPTPLAGDLAFAGLSLGGTTACGVIKSGAGYCWGEGQYGQLGNGETGSGTHAVQPTAVTGGLTFRTVTAGVTHVCGLTIGGKAYCWGNNVRGYLGVAPSGFSGEPLEVAGGHTFSALVAGWYHTCGLAPEDEVWCWGSGGTGALGRDPALGDSFVPVRILLSRG